MKAPDSLGYTPAHIALAILAGIVVALLVFGNRDDDREDAPEPAPSPIVPAAPAPELPAVDPPEATA